jgi:tetratricopeptide (TPR) repeat protein
MRRAAIAVVAVCITLAGRAQTRIASDIEIREMEEAAKRAKGFDASVSAHYNLGELRHERNESEGARREYETTLKLAREERDDARRDKNVSRYALACGWSGVSLAGLDRDSEAFAVLEEAVRYAADSPGVWNLYSSAMFRLGVPRKAIGAARMSVAAAQISVDAAQRSADVGKRKMLSPARHLLELNVHRYALAQALLSVDGDAEDGEAENILRQITQSLESQTLEKLRKTVGTREEFQIVAAPTTERGMYLSIFNRAHMRLAWLYETAGSAEKARAEYQTVVSQRSDEAAALAGLARLASDPQERDRYLSQSLDANPFALDVVEDYELHVQAGNASPAAGASVGSRVRQTIQQIHASDMRGARQTLETLLAAHPNNDVLQSLMERASLSASSGRPWFLAEPKDLVPNPSEADLRAVLSLFAADTIAPADRATLDQAKFSSIVMFDAVDGQTFRSGTMNKVPFRFQNPTRFEGIDPTASSLRVTYRILGATTVDDRDALLIEPLRAKVEK